MGKYDSIIDKKRPISKKHKPMTLLNRAAQFSAFAALSGYEENIKEENIKNDNKYKDY